MRTTRLLLVPLVGTFLLACGGAGTAEEEGPVEETLEEIDETTGVDTMAEEPGAEPERVMVRATSFAYEPSAITVGSGPVRFVVTNAADIVHGFEVEGQGLESAIEEIPAGTTDSLTVEFEAAGEYRIYCPVGDHESRGMTGTLTVE